MNIANEPVFPSGSVTKVRLRPHDPGSDFYVSAKTTAEVGGMTLRQHAAIETHKGLLAGIVSNPDVLRAINDEASGFNMLPERYVAIMALRHTDALLAELSKE